MFTAATVLAPLIAIFGTGAFAIASSKVAVINSDVPDFTGPAGAYVIAAVGAVTSQFTVLSRLVDAVFGLPKLSVATPAKRLTTTVPSVVIPLTATL
jgi:hypothetical protein